MDLIATLNRWLEEAELNTLLPYSSSTGKSNEENSLPAGHFAYSFSYKLFFFSDIDVSRVNCSSY